MFFPLCLFLNEWFCGCLGSHATVPLPSLVGTKYRRVPESSQEHFPVVTKYRRVPNPLRIEIHQRGVQWKQSVVIDLMLYTSFLYNTTPIHCTPIPLHPPVMNTHRSTSPFSDREGDSGPRGRQRDAWPVSPPTAQSRALIIQCNIIVQIILPRSQCGRELRGSWSQWSADDGMIFLQPLALQHGGQEALLLRRVPACFGVAAHIFVYVCIDCFITCLLIG